MQFSIYMEGLGCLKFTSLYGYSIIIHIGSHDSFHLLASEQTAEKHQPCVSGVLSSKHSPLPAAAGQRQRDWRGAREGEREEG